MGYIKKVVDTGVEFADSYKMPEYVAKARESSKLIDVASEKIENFYCLKGSQYLQMVDELTAAKINTALDIANNKVEQAQKLKTAAAGKVSEKKTEAFEMAKLTKATIEDKTSKAKQDGIAKYTAFKIEASKKVDETKTIMRKRYNHVSEEAVQFGQTLETKLKEKASKNEYANKVLLVVLKTKEQVIIYGEAIVKKSLSLPLTLQERMEKGLSSVKEQVEVSTENFQVKKAEFVEAATVKYAVVRAKLSVIKQQMTSENALAAVNSVFGEKAAIKAEGMYKKLTGVNAKVSKQVAAKMKDMYARSTVQVGEFAKIAETMEEKYVGTTLVFRARARFAGK